MSRQRCYVATAEDGGQRLDTLLAARGLYPSRSAAASAANAGAILVNGAPAAKSLSVKVGDAIVYELAEVSDGAPRGEAIPLDIRYEDDELIVLAKPTGLVCHPSYDHPDHTLVNALIPHCGLNHLCDVQGQGDRQGIVHRLDQDTSGLMLAAKTDEAGLALMDAIRTRSVDRRYLALVHGVIAGGRGTIDAPIARAETQRTRMTVREGPGSREAITTFKVLERFRPAAGDDGYTLVECKLFTGRTHQIRVHMAFAHHPVVGDPVYNAHGPKTVSANLGLDRQFLHSAKLAFTHPITGQSLVFEDDLPADLAEALATLSPRSEMSGW